METTQTNLLQAVKDSQNREAWGHFYRIYAPMLRNFARRIGLDETDIDDVTQEVLLIAQRSLREQRYDPARGRFRTWLYGITRRQALVARRARRRRTRVQTVPTDGGVDLLAQIEDRHGEETAQEIWRQEWRYALLEEAIRQVRHEAGGRPFEAFYMFAIQQRPAQEVAQRLGIAPASVYVYKSRMLEAIRRWVRQFEET